MSYASKRPSISKNRRAAIFLAHNGVCWLCKLKIAAGEPYDIDHQVARQLGGSDGDENLAPVHRPCHRRKTRRDVGMIAKSNRLIRKRPRGALEISRPERKPGKIQQRKANWPSRKIENRGWK